MSDLALVENGDSVVADELLTVDELALRLGLGQRRVYELIEQFKLPYSGVKKNQGAGREAKLYSLASLHFARQKLHDMDTNLVTLDELAAIKKLSTKTLRKMLAECEYDPDAYRKNPLGRDTPLYSLDNVEEKFHIISLSEDQRLSLNIGETYRKAFSPTGSQEQRDALIANELNIKRQLGDNNAVALIEAMQQALIESEQLYIEKDAEAALEAHWHIHYQRIVEDKDYAKAAKRSDERVKWLGKHFGRL